MRAAGRSVALVQAGLHLPLIGEFADPAVVLEVARRAEEAGWQGFFVSDHVYGGDGTPVGDAFVALAGIAAVTSKIRLGPLVTPVARRRPWVLARQTTSVDHLSGGRLIFGAGLGIDEWQSVSTAFSEVARQEGEQQELVDESLAVLLALWSGKPVRHDGRWLHIDSEPFLPVPVQQPRIPMWVGARWPRRNSFRRAALAEGIYPIFTDAASALLAPPPADVKAIRDEVVRQGAGPQHDLVIRGALGPDWKPEALERLRALEAVGMTWWLEGFSRGEPLSSVLERVGAGPPVLG